MAGIQDFVDDDGEWQCINCGACCLLGPLLFPDKPEMARMDRGDGGCIHLSPADKTTTRMYCRIYQKRPRICHTKINSPNATHLERAIACNGLRGIMEAEIEAGKRKPNKLRERIM